MTKFRELFTVEKPEGGPKSPIWAEQLNDRTSTLCRLVLSKEFKFKGRTKKINKTEEKESIDVNMLLSFALLHCRNDKKNKDKAKVFY